MKKAARCLITCSPWDCTNKSNFRVWRNRWPLRFLLRKELMSRCLSLVVISAEFPSVNTSSPARNLNIVPLLSGVSATSHSVHRCQGSIFFLCKASFVRGSNSQRGTLSCFIRTCRLCVSIPRLLIAAWPLTLTANNRITCCGHRPWSRSYKCTAHVCMNLSINVPPCYFWQSLILILWRSLKFTWNSQVWRAEHPTHNSGRVHIPVLFKKCASCLAAWNVFESCLALPYIVQTGVTACQDCWRCILKEFTSK